MRASHTGQLPDLIERGIKALNYAMTLGDRTKTDSRLASILKWLYWKAVRRRERLSVFYTFGYPNRFTYDFASRNMERQTKQAGSANVQLPPELSGRLRELGVATCDVVERDPRAD